MTLFKKILPYYKDFIFQSIVFYLLQISPLGSLGWNIIQINCIGCGSHVSIIFEMINSYKTFYDAIINILYHFIFTLSIIFPTLISNIYFARIGNIKPDKFSSSNLFTMLKMSLFSILYFILLFIFMPKSGVVYFAIYSLFPIGINVILYLAWIYLKENKKVLRKDNGLKANF